ncbi:purine-nucleoside phosphorylase [Levilactobacillus spicheri]|uniref:Purine nucleoside phosphorylase DeoD-type n=2 Tax=Levilactobacillus spicheri TaxID=216463 RepID=A0A0F3RYJ6_9LACO|nr:purine-nucleoside phosphorylase [Levilactobacillus spicheri]KJW13867.1 purine nucleoside phosphorylase [Levilactobacillus spicheri]KRL47037.1 purine nucleoside phosphorylase [Levilactobacillus spicheri DSM 15429]GEO67048.1 purine nucleoside phosphorylase DeoD-type [Levilactobacillus spicheri]
MSNHLEAKMGDIADTVLMPGDPLRAKYIAETFLEDPVCYNRVRNAFGYTGTYKGKRISIQGTGMGIPSISIYTNELIKDYGAKKLFRVGTSGGMSPDVHVRDVVLAQGATTDSAIIQNTFGSGMYYAPISDFGLLDTAYHAAKDLDIPVRVGNILAEDRFYNDEMDRQKLIDYGVIATEMESAALFMLAAKYHVKALSVLTISNHLVTGESTSPEEREKSFNDMIKVALEAAVQSD